jgi:hypothetical protein
MTDIPSDMADDELPETGQLNIPAAEVAEVSADIAAAPVVGWQRALMAWAGTGRAVAEFARIEAADRSEVSALLGLGDSAKRERGLLVDIAVRWAVEANLLRLRTGILRPAKRHLHLLDDAAALWFRALSAMARPDMAFTELLAEYSGSRYRPYSPWHDLAELTAAVAGTSALDEAQLANWYARRWGLGHDHADDAEGARIAVRGLALLASALGLLTRDGDGRWTATGLGRVCAVMVALPRVELEEEPDPEISLISTPDGQAEPGFVVKVSLRHLGVWRRLRLPGELTAYGLHTVIQAAFGWHGDHLHTLDAGPFTFAPSWPVLEEAIPSEMVTLADLGTLGVRELSYRYDLGDCWDHEIIVERILPPGDVTSPECLAGRGITPAEDGGEWYEDDDGNLVPAAESEPEARRVYDLARINRVLALTLEEEEEEEEE